MQTIRHRSWSRHRIGRRAYLRMGLMSGAVLLGAAAAGCGWGEPRRPHWAGWRHGGWDGDPVAAKQHARDVTRWALKSVDATDAQQMRVDAIIDGLVDDLAPLAEQHRANHDAMVAAFTGEAVDRAAIERARQADIELAGAGYTRITDAFTAIAEVLTREQRVELAAAMKRHRHWR